MQNIQKVGALASWALGLAFLGLVALLLTLSSQGYIPGSGNNPAAALAFAAVSPIPYIIYLLYALVALLIVLVVLALADRLRERAPVRMRLATILAATAGALFVAYAMLGYVGEPLLVAQYQQAAAVGAAAYVAVRVVSNALNTSAILASGGAILLAGWAALGAVRFPRGLAYLLAVAGLLSVLAFLVPVFSLLAPLLYIVWSLWLGAILWRTPAGALGASLA